MRTLSAIAFAAAIAAVTHAQPHSTVTAIRGIRVGHHTLSARPTGCTVVIAERGAVAGVAQRGAAPGTRETNLVRTTHASSRVDAILLSGGSAYGLDAAAGVVRWLDEHGARRLQTTAPIVPAAVLIDLWVGGRPDVRPDADCGYRAAAAASTNPVEEGTIGAGAGATVGKLAGPDRAMKGGIGSAAVALPNGLRVGAIVAVNALGDVIDPQSGTVVAGVRNPDGTLADARSLLKSGVTFPRGRPENTTIGVVVTNARLTNADANRVAAMADAGYARAVTPIHATPDGDTIFALATGDWNGAVDTSVVGGLAADVVAEAIVRAATQATSVAGVPAARDLKK
jgi:L-aminopeptidase/D-esterase-like protein